MYTSSNRPALVIATAALVVATAGVGGPVVARAFDASNADKVDGKHAVGAAATVNQRKGKLVATDPETGRLPNNLIKKAPDADKVDGIESLDLRFPPSVPAGRTVRGAWGFDTDETNDASPRDVGAMIHYPAKIATELTVRLVVPGGGSVTGCGGTWQNPTAASGNLCVYLQDSARVVEAIDGFRCNPFGASVFFSLAAGLTTDAYAVGTWAATPGTTNVSGGNYCGF